ncbi:MAG: DNRLRE domain-containing protein [Gammaproteobacteria bacterium]|nr:DNRLRE domain-containing protein [Gammaproteobacteria bacterium]
MRFQLLSARRDRGYILLPVVILIAAIAAIAVLNSQQSAMNLQLAGNEFDNIEAEYVAQAGMQHATQQLGRQGCGPFSDITNFALGEHNYSATLNTSQAATDSLTLNVDQDNWIRSDSPAVNNGNDNSLKLYFNAGTKYRPMYRFNLTGILPGSTILSATAKFHVLKEHPLYPVTIHRITEDWAEDTATWNSMSSNLEQAILATIPPQPNRDQWVSVNLTAQVQAWVNGQANYGIMFDTDSDGMDAEYSSRDSVNAPILEVITGDLPAASNSIDVTGTLANGSRHDLTRQNIQLQQVPAFQHAYQPNANDMDDSRIEQGETLQAFGIDNVIRVQDDDIRGLLRFDISRALPKGAILNSARLELYAPVVNRDGDMLLHNLERDWVEGDCATAGCGADWTTYDGTNNWDIEGGDFDSQVIDQITTSGPNKWYSLDITEIARQWLNGERENHGLLLRGSDSIDILMNSSDHPDSWTHPRLLLTYSCECGQNCLLPQGKGQIALIYGASAGQLQPEDELKKAYMESWGYTVNTYEDNSLGSLNIDAYNTLFISNTVVAGNVGNQFTDDSIGIVTDEILLDADLSMATAAWTESGVSVDIIDNNHFITAPFAPGSLSIYDLPMEILSVGGTEAAGLETLARINGTGGLVVLDEGAQQLDGDNAAGRRVILPLGRNTETNFNWNYLNSNSLLMVQRALEWSKALRCSDDDYRDNFSVVSFGNNDGSVNFSNNWQEQDGFGAGPGGGNVEIWGGKLYMDDKPNRAGPRMIREFNLNGADAAILSFDFEMNQVDLGQDRARLHISTDGSNWTELVDFGQWSGSYSGSITLDISAYMSPTTQLRFRITNGYSQGNEYIAFDNLRIGVCGSLN